MDPVTFAQLWIVVKPVKRIRNAIRKRRGLPPLTDGDAMKGETLTLGVLDEQGNVTRVIERAEPIVAARTSSKLTAVGITSMVAALGALVPFYDEANALIMQACQSENGPAAVLIGAGGAFIVSIVTARLTKSPIEPGAV